MSLRELRHDSPSGRFPKSRGLSASVSFLSSSPSPPPALLLAPFFARSLTLVPRCLPNRTETLATQAIGPAELRKHEQDKKREETGERGSVRAPYTLASSPLSESLQQAK